MYYHANSSSLFSLTLNVSITVTNIMWFVTDESAQGFYRRTEAYSFAISYLTLTQMKMMKKEQQQQESWSWSQDLK